MKALRVSFGFLFLLFAIAVTVYSVYFIWIAIIGIGWSGREMSLLEFLWFVKAPILISLFSFISAFGLLREKRWGSLFGLGLCISAMFLCAEFIITEIDSGNIDSTLELFGSSLHLFISFCFTVGILKLINAAYKKLKLKQYITLGLVVSSVLLSYYTLFS
ncbi:hypothetical protein POV27_16735 [Aureisphaera galaxeae]|uniref:hypothetical protein n=1 Tax=Aureisphaera galaxeae TaxID=1538023 RepID=UPI002350330F|nr:hypothetical protein [Aureisphaera galaxeae]MDC8005707.1 hypothetical protein [Aureisphaera galaxeae]